MAAAVGSLMMRRTLRPAMVPASLVDCALAVVEVGGDSDDGVLHLTAEVVLSDGAHLVENHGGDLLGLEALLLALEHHLDHRLALLVHHLERPQLYSEGEETDTGREHR